MQGAVQDGSAIGNGFVQTEASMEHMNGPCRRLRGGLCGGIGVCPDL